MAQINPEQMGAEDCLEAIRDGAQASDFLRSGEQGADENLINAMGTGWVLDAAGAPDHSEESWNSYGAPWCKRYAAAFRLRAQQYDDAEVFAESTFGPTAEQLKEMK